MIRLYASYLLIVFQSVFFHIAVNRWLSNKKGLAVLLLLTVVLLNVPLMASFCFPMANVSGSSFVSRLFSTFPFWSIIFFGGMLRIFFWNLSVTEHLLAVTMGFLFNTVVIIHFFSWWLNSAFFVLFSGIAILISSLVIKFIDFDEIF